jgi:hypothetical protein
VQRNMVAITDGQLQSKINHEIRAVVECKKSERKVTDTMIAMQEAALFAAWIHEYSLHPSLYVPTHLYQTPNGKLTLAAASLSHRTRCNSLSLSLGHQRNGWCS